MARGRWAPWLHAVVVGLSAAGALVVTIGPRYAWVGALIVGVSKTAGSAIATYGRPQPLTPRELLTAAHSLALELHVVTQKVSTLLAEAQLMGERLERRRGPRSVPPSGDLRA